MCDQCSDNRFELIEKYKKKLVEATNIETNLEEMKVINNILFRFWQMGWLDKLEQPPAPSQLHWILMKEKLPEEAGRYLVWMPLAPPKRRVTIAEYCDGYWNIKTPVLAWMPLPLFDREQEADAQITIKNIKLQEAMK